ncbi:MAG TPA: GntR family transcriptional regulator [Terriglobales bacterium]|nr:GntR family transcriptional regulator [Terriglobales bacterium]
MSLNGRKATPAYQRIQNAIRQRIESGHLKSGDMVASERELARIHKVSLMTARHALAGLEREGIVERRRGSGTFVAPPRIHFNKLMSYTEQMLARGLVPISKVIASKIVEDEEEITGRLSLPSGSKLVKIERVRHTSDEPFAVETCYLPAERFSGLTREPLGKSSLFSLLEREYDLQLTYADEEVDATAADGRIAQLLEVPRGSPVLRIRQVIYSSNGRPVIYVVGFYRSERHSLFIRRFR